MLSPRLPLSGFPLRAFPLLALLILAPLAHAAPVPTNGTLAVVHLGDHVLLTWTPSPSAPLDTYEIYGLADGVKEFLGTAAGLSPAFLAPAGYDAYVVASTTSGQEWTSDKWCIVVNDQTVPPTVRIDFYCGSSRVTRAVVHPVIP